MDVLENNIIAAVIYALGVEIGRSGRTVPVAANLLQQHPVFDRQLGDLLLESPGVTLLFEFKRANDRRNKEEEKVEAIRKAILRLDGPAEVNEMASISRMIHQYIQSEVVPVGEGTSLNIELCPYIDLARSDLEIIDISQLVAKICRFIDFRSDESFPDLADEYLQLVRKASPSKAGASGMKGGVAVFKVAEGKLSYAILNDITDLNQTVQKLQLTHQRNMQQSQSRGMSM
jgi:hypothetical protein